MTYFFFGLCCVWTPSQFQTLQILKRSQITFNKQINNQQKLDCVSFLYVKNSGPDYLLFLDKICPQLKNMALIKTMALHAEAILLFLPCAIPMQHCMG